ncbi:UspA [Dillenia turbinata]|uniref:RING-type E3 ubiquitin transferase n=1 Tax=Dillenia turbinata TaxID=194707 RepID=A0AAN8V942_9MAGN
MSMSRQSGVPEEWALPPGVTLVAVDKDKNSHGAVKWAIDHLLHSNPNLTVIHVKIKHQTDEPVDPDQLFLPYRGYCARKGIQLKEVLVEDTDVTKGILEYIANKCISNLVVGASPKGSFTRKFWSVNIGANLVKSAPDFCSVYVVSKGKAQTVRSATRPLVNTAAPPRHPPSVGLPPHFPYDNPTPVMAPPSLQENDDFRRPARRSVGNERMLTDRNNDLMRLSGRPLSSAKTVPTPMLLENMDAQIRGRISTDRGRPSIDRGRNSVDHGRSSTASRSSFSDESDYMDSIIMESHDSSEFSDSMEEANRLSLHRDIEAEMRRLRQELKQTMDMYSNACKEALSAKQMAKELSQMKVEEARRLEEARIAEEAALALAEMEKAKCKAAMEAAEAAQKIAEMEAKKRRYAELKAKKEADEKNRALNVLANNDVRYRKYTIEEIEQATQKFSDSLKLGEGGYGPVYKGRLDHTPVAIKVLRPDAAQGRKQFQQEVEVLSCMRHPHMVLLLGACPEYGCLVYEYMNNGSLEDRLFRRGDTPPIPWRIRFKIAAEIATALLFLHQAKPEPLVHRDLKPANILLDNNYVSKISDVGLARLVPPSVADNVTQYHMTSAAGTFCYIDPEYQQTGMLTIKSDIYSLGIMLLQLVTAKPPMGIAHHVQRALEKGRFEDMLDQTVTDWPVEEAAKFARMALRCAELRKKDRPDLGSVILPELYRLLELGSDQDPSRGTNSGQSFFANSSGTNSAQSFANSSQTQTGGIEVIAFTEVSYARGKMAMYAK